MPYEPEMAQLAKGATAAHGQLKEIVFLEANKDSLLVFSDGTVLPALHQQHGYDIRREAYATQLARDHSGTDYSSLLAFGYSGTGPTCYAAFLRAAGFHSTNVEKLTAPLKLRWDGSQVRGAERNGSIEWEDGSETPAPSTAKLKTPEMPQVRPISRQPSNLQQSPPPKTNKWWQFWK